MTGALLSRIYPLYASLFGQEKAKQECQHLSDLSLSELLVWLANQSDSLRYQLALDLDIPLQHLNTTCDTVKKLSLLQ